jgi:hypothetical protein
MRLRSHKHALFLSSGDFVVCFTGQHSSLPQLVHIFMSYIAGGFIPSIPIVDCSLLLFVCRELEQATSISEANLSTNART